jgi:hypothetical protein
MLHARADLVAFLDHDDLATPRRLELQVVFLEAHPDIGLLGGAMEEIDVRGQTMGIRYVPPTDDAAIRDKLASGSPIVTPSVMARKADLLRVGGFRSQYEASDDYDLWLRLMPYIKFANLPEILVKYRVHSSSLSRSRILYYALTTPAAQAAARLRQAGKADPTEGIPHLTPEILLALGIDGQRTVDLQATSLVSYASKMVSRGVTDAAGDLLEQLETLNLWPALRSRIAPEALLVRVRILLRQRKHLSAFWLLVRGFLTCPGMVFSLTGKAWRFACRLTSKVGRTLCRR